MKNFILIGAAGYIAPRHLKAISDNRGSLIACNDIADPKQNVSEYFSDVEIFSSFSEFDNFVTNYQLEGNKVDYLTVCSPNFMHFEHISWALEKDINVICEKPLVLELNQLDKLISIEAKSSASVFSILQLRYHKEIVKLKEKYSSSNLDKKAKVSLTYITPRNKNYLKTWKGDDDKSGGIVTNIGIHFFDMLYYLFGRLVSCEVYLKDKISYSGKLNYEFAEVDWFLSIDGERMPKHINLNKNPSYRSISINHNEVDFSGGFENLHTLSYEKILLGEGFRIEDNRPAIEIVDRIRNSEVTEEISLKKTHDFLTK